MTYLNMVPGSSVDNLMDRIGANTKSFCNFHNGFTSFPEFPDCLHVLIC